MLFVRSPLLHALLGLGQRGGRSVCGWPHSIRQALQHVYLHFENLNEAGATGSGTQQLGRTEQGKRGREARLQETSRGRAHACWLLSSSGGKQRQGNSDREIAKSGLQRTTNNDAHPEPFPFHFIYQPAHIATSRSFCHRFPP